MHLRYLSSSRIGVHVFGKIIESFSSRTNYCAVYLLHLQQPVPNKARRAQKDMDLSLSAMSSEARFPDPDCEDIHVPHHVATRNS
jgi:hypothetical protein